MSGAASKVYIMGAFTDPRSRDMLAEAQVLLKSYGITLLLVQGSYNLGVKASAGTHDGGGCVDISVLGWSSSDVWLVLKVLRQVGFAAWHRTPAQGFTYHIHAVAIGCVDLAWLASAQVEAYKLRYNGLGYMGKGGPDDGPDGYRTVTWESYKRGTASASGIPDALRRTGTTTTPASLEEEIQMALLSAEGQAQIRMLISEEVGKVFTTSGVNGAGDVQHMLQAGYYGAMVQAAVEAIRSEGVPGSGDVPHMLDAGYRQAMIDTSKTANDLSVYQAADGSWSHGAQLLSLMVRALAEVSVSQGYAGAADPSKNGIQDATNRIVAAVAAEQKKAA